MSVYDFTVLVTVTEVLIFQLSWLPPSIFSVSVTVINFFQFQLHLFWITLEPMHENNNGQY